MNRGSPCLSHHRVPHVKSRNSDCAIGPILKQGKVSCCTVGAVRSSRSTVPCGWDMIITSCGTAALSFKNQRQIQFYMSMSAVYPKYILRMFLIRKLGWVYC